MFSFADSAWHVFSATAVFIFGAWVAIYQKRIFQIPQKWALFLYLWHSFFCIAYFLFSLNNSADSRGYFVRSLIFDADLRLGTRAIDALTSIFTTGLGFSYGGAFLVYNIFGFIGMLAFASALQQIVSGRSKNASRVALIVILLPGLSFWSVAIGKDALTFMGASMAAWSALSIGRRYPALVLGALAIFVARPHMAGLLLAAAAISLLVASRMGIVKKSVLVMISFPIAAFAVVTGVQFVGLANDAGLAEVESFIERRQELNLGGGSSVDISAMSLPLRLFTYLFRPLFFDGLGALGLVSSFENLFILLLVLTAIFGKLRGRKSGLEGFAVAFFVMFVAIAWVLLANVTANLGIALRQKWMFMPMLMLLVFSYAFRVERR